MGPCFWGLENLHRRLKMYLLLKMVMFHCHVSFEGEYTWTEIVTPKQAPEPISFELFGEKQDGKTFEF